MPTSRNVSTDRWLLSVTLIQTECTGLALNPSNLGSATGFFYRSGKNQYLITNRHVVIDEKKSRYPDSIILRVHTSDVDATQNRDVRISLYDTKKLPIWLEHPILGKTVDVVAIEVTPYLKETEAIYFLSQNDFKPSNLLIGVGDSVLIMGYPMKFYDEKNNIAITKSGTVASPYDIGFSGQPYFLIDANLQNGTSGSPVILPASGIRRFSSDNVPKADSTGFPPYLIGIHSGGNSLGLNQVWYPSLINDIIGKGFKSPDSQPKGNTTH